MSIGDDEPRPFEEPDDDDAREAGRDEGARPRLEGATDLIRRAVASGLGALFATEEGLRKVAGDLPKEAVSFLAGQAQHTKDEVLRVVTNELRRFLDNLDLDAALRKTLANITLEVKTEIRFKPTEPGAALKADVRRMRVGIRRRGGSPPPDGRGVS